MHNSYLTRPLSIKTACQERIFEKEKKEYPKNKNILLKKTPPWPIDLAKRIVNSLFKTLHCRKSSNSYTT